MGKLEGKVAIITGAGSGIGQATALLFAKEGAKVVVADLVSEGGKETVKLIKDGGGEAIFTQADVSKAEDVKKMVQTTINKYGKLNVLYNNAGIGGQGVPITDITEEGWNRAIDINLKGVWLGMKYAIPQMLKQGGGSIINNASIAGFVVIPGGSAEYDAAKAGVVKLTKNAAVQFGAKNIRVNCICAGFFPTPMMENWLQGSKEAWDKISQLQPMNRVGTLEDIAQAALFLAADECSSFITGEALVIDGGYTLVGRGEKELK